MESSDLDIAIKSLEDRSDTLRGWLIAFTLLVVLGLVVEYWPDAVKLFKLIEIRLRPLQFITPDKRSRAKTLGRALIGGVLVTVGVAGEFWIMTKESRVDTAMRGKNHLAQAQLEKDAGDAKKEAGDSNSAAGAANERAAAAGLQAANAGGVAAKANERAGALEVEAAKQRVKAAVAETALFRLQQRLKPRQLGDSQLARLIDSLRRSPAKGLVHITANIGDSEIIAFAAQLDSALLTAGWQTTNGMIALKEPKIGIFLRVRSATSVPRFALELLRAFKDAGIPLIVAPDSEVPTNDWVGLFVGFKPQPVP